ncbi:SDR family oxidoreductase [Rhodobacteraceae bacterium NNCM2]|nr:SDR family oxidoreductase [Coraliihabitans acroporae]
MSGDRFSIAGCVACVTGASSGIGQAMADALAEAGAKVVGIARREEALAYWAAGAGERAAITGDVGVLADLPELARRAAEPFGPPDILIPAAGINPRKHADEVTPEEWDATLRLNLSHPFLFAREFVPAMKEKGWGRIINIASLQTTRAFTNGIAYGASKGGVGQLTRAMAEAWSPHGITANAIAPGFFPTALSAAVFADKEMASHHARMTCLGRNGTMEDLIGPMLFLAAPASDYVTGQVLAVDGGYTAK